MNFKFNLFNFLLFLLLFVIEIVIAIYLKQGFIRHTFGDFLVVIMLYYFIKSFIKTKSIYIALVVLIFVYCVEFLQLLNILDYLNLRQNTLATLILGSHFSVQDLIAYTLGVISIYIINKIGFQNE